jgi:competence protein ComEC
VGEQVVAPALRALRVRRIDLLVLSHAHEDHVGGLPAILRQFPVGQVLDAAGPVDAKSYATFRELIRARRIPFTEVRQGVRVALGPRRAAVLEVLYPPQRLLTGTGSDVNNNSVVLRLTAGGSIGRPRGPAPVAGAARQRAPPPPASRPPLRFLLTGDAEAAAEAALRDLDVQAALLKVGHHGSRTSTIDAWLDAVRPRLAVISCGRHNSFGHPGRATLTRLRRHAVTLFRTDRDGAVTVSARDGRIEARGTLARAALDNRVPGG